MEYEDIISSVGGYGKYQKKTIAFILFPVFITQAVFAASIIFLLSTPDHWCYEPAFDNFNLSSAQKQNLLRPVKNAHGHEKPDQCNMYNLTGVITRSSNYQDLTAHMNTSESILIEKCNNGWEYDKGKYKSTITTKWNLVCEMNYFPSVIYTLGSVSSAIATIAYNLLSDRFGRRPIFLLATVALITGSLGMALGQNFTFLLVAFFVRATVSPATFQLCYVMIIENIPPDMRARVNGLASIGWTTGFIICPLLAYLTADWVIFSWVLFACSVPLLLYFLAMPESSRWLITRGRYVEAAKQLYIVAKENNADISFAEVINSVEKVGEKSLKSENSSALSLMRFPKTRLRFITICVTWSCAGMSYYGFHLLATQLYGNEFLNFFFLSIAEVPAHFLSWYLMETKLGRRWSGTFFFVVEAVACLIPLFTGSDEIAMVASAMVGKFAAAGAFSIIYQQMAELFHTSVRSSSLGIAGTVTNIVSIATPSIIYLSIYGPHIPFTVLGSLSLLAMVISTFLPETLNEYLPQTIEDCEKIRQGKFFSFAKMEMKTPTEPVTRTLLVEDKSRTDTDTV